MFSSVPSFKQYWDTNYFYTEPRFDEIFLRNNLPTTKDGAYVTNFDDKNGKGRHWFSQVIDRNAAVYFYSFGIEYIPQEALNKFKDKSTTYNIFKYKIMNLLCVTSTLG